MMFKYVNQLNKMLQDIIDDFVFKFVSDNLSKIIHITNDMINNFKINSRLLNTNIYNLVRSSNPGIEYLKALMRFKFRINSAGLTFTGSRISHDGA